MWYVSRDDLKKSERQQLPEYLIGDKSGRRYNMVYMGRVNRMLCAACATVHLLTEETVIPMYVAHGDICRGCGKVVEEAQTV